MELQNREIKINYSTSLYKIIGRAIGVITILVLASLLFYKNNQYAELQQNLSAANAELEISRNEKGQLVAKIESFQTQRAEDFLAFATRDSLTMELQKEVKEMKKYLRKQGSVTIFSTEGNAQVTTETEVVKDSVGSPVYKSKFDLDGWVFGRSVATKDSTFYDIGYKDEYSLTIGIEPTGFLGLGKGTPFGQITSHNPYNTIKTMKVYQVGMPPRKNLSIGPSLNVGVDFTGKIYTTIGISIQPEKLTLKI